MNETQTRYTQDINKKQTIHKQVTNKKQTRYKEATNQNGTLRQTKRWTRGKRGERRVERDR
jgi:hypothetical protein